MKNFSIKILSVLISVSILISILVFVPVNADAEAPGTDIPLIYISGYGGPLAITGEDGNEKLIYPVEVPKEEFVQIAIDNIDIFAKALVTQEWTDFGNLIRDTIHPYYANLALDENGQPTDGSTSQWEWRKFNKRIDTQKHNGKYNTTQFRFGYDWRLDPYQTADKLHSYIESVKEKTGATKVALLGRCLGACVVAAYMDKYKYDCEYVSNLILYASALNGSTMCSKLYAGDLYLDPDGIERLVYDFEISADKMVNELIQSFVTVFNDTYGLDLACWAFNNVWEDIYLDILPQIFIDSFGTWPGFWSMVNDNDYERAKENVFHNQDTDEKWANFIEIIDNYHYNVQVKAPENFKKYEEKGVVISNITKYGFQATPISAPTEELSDFNCSVTDASMGATTSLLNSTLSDEYIASLETDKFVSPDKQIDASTCLFQERTWFIKNLRHDNFPDEIDPLIDAIVNNPGMTIYSNEKYPQYMVYDNENTTLSPMTSDNFDTTQRYHHTFWDALKILIEDIYKLLKNMIKDKISQTN